MRACAPGQGALGRSTFVRVGSVMPNSNLEGERTSGRRQLRQPESRLSCGRDGRTYARVARQECPGHRRHLGDRPGDRRPFRRIRRKRRDQLPSHARGSNRDRGARARLPRSRPANGCPRRARSRRRVREEDVVAMLESAVDGLGGLDVLVNNAGIQISRPSHELSASDFDRVLAVNLRGAFLCAREAVKRFLATGTPGAIINVSSVHQAHPEAQLPRLRDEQGRDGEPDPDARPRVRGAGHTRERDRARRHRYADQSCLDRRPGEARDGGVPYPDGASPALPTRWPA